MKQALSSPRRRLLLAGCFVAGGLLPTPVLAHVKWFTDAAQYPLRADLIWSDRTLLWVASSVLAVAILYLAHRAIAGRTWPFAGWLAHMAAAAPTILSIQVAITLIANAVHPALLAPNLDLPSGPVGIAVAGVEIIIAFTLITGVGDWLGGSLLVALVLLAGVMFSPIDALEQIFWIGIGVTLLVIGRDSPTSGVPRPFFRRPDPIWRHRAIVALRVLTGVSLVVVALTEKLWNPDLGRAFLLDRPELNIFQTLPGLGWFTNDMFVLVAGLTEAAIGAMLISGFAPRLVILAMWAPFNLGIPILPAQELLGHLPILGIMCVLLVEGTPTALPAPAALPRRVSVAAAAGRPGHASRRRSRVPVLTARLQAHSE